MIKRLRLFILLLIFICPFVTNAKESSYMDIDKSYDFKALDLVFLDVNYSSNSDNFGLTGRIINNSSNSVTYSSKVSYYDSNYNLITELTSSNIALIGSNDFNMMFSLNNLGQHSIDEIKYYKVSILINGESYYDEIDVADSTFPSKSGLYNSYDYVIDSYNVDINVNLNNTFDITETITAYFNVPKHGIFRTIPLKNEIKRLDGSSSTNRTQITNLSVDDEYTTSREDNNYKIQIGSPNKVLTGEHIYKIKYTYNLGKDPISDYDELYYNIIGNEWDTVIGNITFNITMPKDFDATKLGFSSGSVGSTDNINVKYNVDGNKISGSYDGVLNSGEALTVRCELPEGYFVGAKLMTSSSTYLMFIIPIVSLLISFLLWFIYGRDNKVIETVEFYPPEGFNSLEVAFLYKGKATSNDVVSLLVYLANKGYIKIVETEEKTLISKSSVYKIVKVKDYDGNNTSERKFLTGLFKNTALKDVATREDLYDNFYITTSDILSNINNKKNKYKIFEKSTFINYIIVISLIIISLITIVSIPTLDYSNLNSLFISLFICAFYVPFYAVIFSSKVSGLFRVVCLIFILFHSSFFFRSLPIYDAITTNPIYLYGFIVGIICIVLMVLFFKLMPKRTSYGNEMLGKIKGFKNFLETVEKEKLEAMVTSNPTYFYDILPYTYVLGISDKWIKDFETINLQAPSWYDSNDDFSVTSFGSFMDSTMTSAQIVMSSSSSSSSSSGGSSGGGSSGGGSGGGGGGSW